MNHNSLNCPKYAWQTNIRPVKNGLNAVANICFKFNSVSIYVLYRTVTFTVLLICTCYIGYYIYSVTNTMGTSALAIKKYYVVVFLKV